MGHFIASWLSDIMGHFPSLQAGFESAAALSWLQQAQDFVSGAGVVVCAREDRVRARIAKKSLSFMIVFIVADEEHEVCDGGHVRQWGELSLKGLGIQGRGGTARLKPCPFKTAEFVGHGREKQVPRFDQDDNNKKPRSALMSIGHAESRALEDFDGLRDFLVLGRVLHLVIDAEVSVNQCGAGFLNF